MRSVKELITIKLENFIKITKDQKIKKLKENFHGSVK